MKKKSERGLVISRRIGESVHIGESLVVTVQTWTVSPPEVSLLLTSESVSRMVHLPLRDPEGIPEAPGLHLEFRGWHNGLARLAFLAPRKLRISRIEEQRVS